MKNHLQKLIFSLLIAGLCASFTPPVYAAGNFKYRERQYLEESVAASKDAFFELYGELWRKHKLDAKLAAVADSDTELDQERAIKRFNPYYEEFLRDLEKRFAVENNGHVARFYRNIAAEAVAENEDDPELQDFIIRATKEISRKSAKALQKQLEKSLSKSHRGLYIKPGTTEIGIALPGLSRQVNALIIQKLGEATVNAIGPIIAEVSLPVAGVLVSEWSKNVNDNSNAPRRVREQLNAMSESLTTQQPAYYWEAMESDVRIIFEEASKMFRVSLREAIDSSVGPEVKALIKRRLHEKQ